MGACLVYKSNYAVDRGMKPSASGFKLSEEERGMIRRPTRGVCQVLERFRLSNGSYGTFVQYTREDRGDMDDMDDMEVESFLYNLDCVMQGEIGDDASAFKKSIRNGADTASGTETVREDDEGWLDFNAIKEKADVRAVLSHFGLLGYLEEHGAELTGWCPFGDEHGNKDSFSINVEKKIFQCFACKMRGGLLDFVAKFANFGLREAAQTVQSIMGDGEKKEEKKGGRPYGVWKKEKAVCETVADEREERADIFPAVMPFSLASRLISGKKINPDCLLVLNLDAVGFEFIRPFKVN